MINGKTKNTDGLSSVAKNIFASEIDPESDFLRCGNEHFVLRHFKKRLPHYLILLGASVLFALACGYAFGWSTADRDVTMSFARTVFSLFTLTVTLAIPTCLRSIFAAYDEYYSSMIKELLVERFPITLLMMSAFTAIVFGLLYLSGIASVYVPVPSTVALGLLGFWTIVCVAYMFVAIEKLIHFTANAPGAVLDKLEASVYELVDMETKGDYIAFRDRLASVNDIAATIVQRSTGRDPVVVRCIHALRDIHKTFLASAIEEQDQKARAQRYKACRSTRRELVRIYREAASSKNEHACHTIVKTYCGMIRDSVELRADWLYITEMFSLFERIQSYAFTSSTEEIEGYASVDWAFILMRMLNGMQSTPEMIYAKACIIREIAGSLRSATLEGREDVMLRFARVASNSEIDCSLDDMSQEWLGLVDRAVFDYMTWALRSAPIGVERWLRYLVDYSSPFNHRMRSVLVDSEARFATMHALGRMTDELKKQASAHGIRSSVDPRIVDGSVLSIGILPGMSRAKALAYVIEASWSGCEFEYLAGKYDSMNEALDKYAMMSDDSPELVNAVPMLAKTVTISSERNAKAKSHASRIQEKTKRGDMHPASDMNDSNNNDNSEIKQEETPRVNVTVADPYKDTILMKRIVVNENDS